MRAVDIENWTLRVIDRVNQGLPIEDTRIELKATWIESPNHIARRIAGHCNANAGDDVLWLIGVDEGAGITGVDHRDMAKWWPNVRAQFDGPSPTVQDVVVMSDDATVVALLFTTDRVPFVVRNDAYGKQGGGGGPVQREVPWREATGIRSATHADLVRLLVPVAGLPKLEPYKGEAESHLLQNMEISESKRENYRRLRGTTTVYAVAPIGSAIVLPDHQASGRFTVPQRNIQGDLKVELLARSWSPGVLHFRNRGDTEDHRMHTVHQGDSQILLDGPGFFRFSWHAEFPNIEIENDWESVGLLDISLWAQPAGGDLSATLQISLVPYFSSKSNVGNRPTYGWRWPA